MSADTSTVERGLEIEAEDVNKLLASAYTPLGIKMWWRNAHPRLEGQSPLTIWQAGDRERIWALAAAREETMGT